MKGRNPQEYYVVEQMFPMMINLQYSITLYNSCPHGACIYQ